MVSIAYSDADVAGMDETSLQLFTWDGSQWVDAATTCSPPSSYARDLTNNVLSVAICHLSKYGLFGQAPQGGTLIVKKVVFNDNGGAQTASDFSFSLNGAAAVSFEADGQNDLPVTTGMYSVTEPAAPGYTTSYDNCTDIVIPNGGTATCTITNDDIQPKLIVIKVVSGGPALPGAFNLTVSGNSPSPATFPGAGAPGTTVNLNAGAYSVTETPALDYTASYSPDCTGSVAVGDTKTCTVTNTIVSSTAKITPGNTTCQQFRDGTAGDLTEVLYTVKANKVNSVAPGVFIYYSKVIAPASGSFVIDVLQARSPDIWPYIPTNQVQLILWNANCVKVQNVTVGYNPNTGTATIRVNGGYSSGAVYHVSIKYNPDALIGQSAASKPTVTYAYSTALNGATISQSADSVSIKPKK